MSQFSDDEKQSLWIGFNKNSHSPEFDASEEESLERLKEFSESRLALCSEEVKSFFWVSSTIIEEDDASFKAKFEDEVEGKT